MAKDMWETTGDVTKIDILSAKLTLTTLATRPSGVDLPKKTVDNTATDIAVNDTYNILCTSKSLPLELDAATWKRLLDDPTYVTSETFVGKSEGYDACEFVVPLMLDNVKNFTEHRRYGDLFTLTYTYDDPKETNVYTISLANCVISGVTGETYENNSGPYNCTLKVQPRGGLRANCLSISSSARSSD